MTASSRINSLDWDHGLRRQAIVESLLKDVVQGRLRPGQHLVTRALADRFGVSHTPIREALITLAGIGVVDALPNRGAVVRRVEAKDIREICQVRRALECEAVKIACGRIDPNELDFLLVEFRRLIAMGSPASPCVEEARVVDNRLHDAIASSCGNAFLAQEIGRLKFLFRAFRDLAWEHAEGHNDYRRVAGESREHLAIVEALKANDRLGAARAMSRHIMAGCIYWTRALPEPAAEATIARPSPRSRAEREENPR